MACTNGTKLKRELYEAMQAMLISENVWHHTTNVLRITNAMKTFDAHVEMCTTCQGDPSMLDHAALTK
jgi:hypothetical protein